MEPNYLSDIQFDTLLMSRGASIPCALRFIGLVEEVGKPSLECGLALGNGLLGSMFLAMGRSR